MRVYSETKWQNKINNTWTLITWSFRYRHSYTCFSVLVSIIILNNVTLIDRNGLYVYAKTVYLWVQHFGV